MNLSYSKVNTYLQCPLSYKYLYVDRLETKPKPFFALGESIHQTIQTFYTTEKSLPTFSDLISYLDQSWKRKGYSSLEEESQYREKAITILKDFYKRNIFSYFKAYKIEQRFDVQIEDITISGYIDQINKIGDKYEVIEYKTSQNGLTVEEAENDLQVITYHIAFKEIYGFLPDYVVYHNVRNGKVIKVKVSEEKEVETINLYKDVANKIRKNQFIPKKNIYCKWCDFLNICPEHKVRSF